MKETLDERIVENINKEEANKEKKAHFLLAHIKKMSAFEKLFWLFLLLFLILYIILVGFASYNGSASSSENNNSLVLPEKIIREVEVIVSSNQIKKNLENNKTIAEIKKNLQKNMSQLDQTIDKQIDVAFQMVTNNVDTFLNFHYSVLGEYLELGGMATGKIEQVIEEKLFGSHFSKELQKSLSIISKDYEERLSDHFHFINRKATSKVDLKLNSQIIDNLQHHIDLNMKLQGGKIAVLMSAKLAPKLIQVVATKIAAKTGSKIAAKVATKVGAKSAAAASGAAGGALCGPLFWVCSPIAATALWFGTDAVINSIDEIYNREEFKQDILIAIQKQKYDLKKQLKNTYQYNAEKLSDEMVSQYKQTDVKEIKRVRVKDKIGV